MNESGQKEQRVAVITGSTRGIGRGVAEALVGAGWRVVANSRSADRAREAASQMGPNAVGVAADLERDGGATALIDGTLEAFGRIDALVNNAGVSQVTDSATLHPAEWRRLIDFNLTSPFLCAQAAGAAMLARDGGVIVNVASMLATTGMARRAAYSSSKAGLLALTRVLAIEWAPTIRVNAVAPGYVRTELMDDLVATASVDLDAIVARTPAARVGEVPDVAAAVKYLVSPEAAFVTGHTLAVDGGWTANGEA